MTIENDEIAWASNALAPVRWWPPYVNPLNPGLFSVVSWTESNEPLRWLESGVQIRPVGNFDEHAAGVWGANWCASPDELGPDDVKTGVRPDPNTLPYQPFSVFAFDSCDPSPASRAEVRARVQQILRLQEQPLVERSFAERLLADADVIGSAPDLVAAIGYLEAAFADTNSVGVVHASAKWAAEAARSMLLTSSGVAVKTPMGHRWSLGSYGGLDSVLVATSPVFGWRDAPVLREAMLSPEDSDVFVAIAEHSFVVGYERLIGAVQITTESS